MKIASVSTLWITALLIGGVVIVLLLDTNKIAILQEITAQICCENLTSKIGNITFAKGDIDSLQDSKVGTVAWIVSGTWNLSKVNSSNTAFYAKFEMVKTDSSEWHKYRITDFRWANSSVDQSSVTINGTATVSITRSSLQGVPVSIRIMDYGLDRQTVSIWIDPERVQNHFGSTPIYGTLKKLVR